MNELSIVVPATGSADRIRACIDALAGFLMANPSDTDVIVVANDDAELLDALVREIHSAYPWLQFHLLERIGAARRFGALARFGIAFSTSRFVAMVSPSGEDDLTALPKMLAALRSGAQIAQATRYGAPHDAAQVSPRFRVYQRIYRTCIRMLLGHTVTDSTYGYKMFDRVYVQALGLTQNGYALCPEITMKGLLGGGRVEYVHAAPRSVLGSDFRLLRDGPAYAWILFRGLAHRNGVPWF